MTTPITGSKLLANEQAIIEMMSLAADHGSVMVRLFHTMNTIEPSAMPGNAHRPNQITKAKAKPEGNQTAVTWPGNVVNTRLSFAVIA